MISKISLSNNCVNCNHWICKCGIYCIFIWQQLKSWQLKTWKQEEGEVHESRQDEIKASRPLALNRIKNMTFYLFLNWRKKNSTAHAPLYLFKSQVTGRIFFFGYWLCVGGYSSFVTGFWRQNCLRRVTVTAQPPTPRHRHGLSYSVFERVPVIFTVYAICRGQWLQKMRWNVKEKLATFLLP